MLGFFRVSICSGGGASSLSSLLLMVALLLQAGVKGV
jgi:hypothetical protein